MRAPRFLAAAGIAAAIIAALLVYPRPAGTPIRAQAPPGRVSQCTGTISSTVSPDTVRLCDPLAVTVNVAPECPLCPGGINVVFVQVSNAFHPRWIVQESLSAYDELRRIAAEQKVQIGVVHYDSQVVRAALQMTDRIDNARGPLSGPRDGHDPHGDFVGAARMALKMLMDTRARSPGNDSAPCEFIIYFASTKSIYPDDGANMLEAARMIKSANVELFVGCPEAAPFYYCSYTRQMTKAANYTEYEDHGGLRRMAKKRIDDWRGDLNVRDLFLTQVLPTGLAYVDGSADLPPARVNVSAEGKTTLNWDWKQIRTTAPQTVTFGAKPMAEGTWMVEGSAKLVDLQNKIGEMVMPAQAVTVTGACLPPPTPEPTDTPTDLPTSTYTPTATPTPTFTPTPTPALTATPTATPTPRPLPIYLPILVHERCKEQWVYSDVVLVIDLSTSMNGALGGGRTKLEATLDAARQFVSILDLTPDANDRSDRVAVVGFNSRAWQAARLTRDATALRQAIDHLPSSQGQFTRLDLGFDEGIAALRPSLRQANTTPVIILLTDGVPNQVPPDPGDGTMETTVRLAAQRAKDAGVTVYTIGIGLPEDINAALMAQCAAVPANFFYTPDPEELAGIYAQIAYSFGCPAGRHDWTQPWP